MCACSKCPVCYVSKKKSFKVFVNELLRGHKRVWIFAAVILKKASPGTSSVNLHTLLLSSLKHSRASLHHISPHPCVFNTPCVSVCLVCYAFMHSHVDCCLSCYCCLSLYVFPFFFCFFLYLCCLFCLFVHPSSSTL